MENIRLKSIIYMLFAISFLGCGTPVKGDNATEIREATEPADVGNALLEEDLSKKKKIPVEAKKGIEKKDITSTQAPKKNHRNKQKGIARIKDILRRYRTTSGVLMDVEKKVYLSLMDDEKVSKGKSFLSKGNLRLEISEPEKSLLIVTKKLIWLESRFEQDIQVSKMAMEGRGRKKGLIGIFFEKESIWDGYKLVKAKTKNSQVTYTLRPLPTLKRPDATKVVMVIDKKYRQVMKLKYWDDLENSTTYLFSKINFGVKHQASLFEYSPPKGASVTTY